MKFVNLMINEGSALDNVAVIKVQAIVQNLKGSYRDFRREMFSKGFSASFYEKFLYIIPIDKVALNTKIYNIKRELRQYFHKDPKNIRVQSINLTADDYWYPLGVKAIRHTLRCSIERKIANDPELFLRGGLQIYNKTFERSYGSCGILKGISLEKVVRIKGENNIALVPTLRFDCFAGNYERVEDPTLRSRIISRFSSRLGPIEYERHMDELMKRILPIVAYISNKKLYFRNWKYSIEVEEGLISLDRWL
ncbi:hypothetical protein DRO64_09110 [Candidatus Bathyarchaeota archaeon]|nr:MAG: hypothetical protein DRO64_09110 [Candidatus Bathyarchaeota archaeon]